MFSLPGNCRRSKPWFGAAIVAALMTSGCAYRFTNLAMRAPAGISSIAVEAVYDTSREVLPHDILWIQLQRAIAENGKLKLTSQDQADALMRAHITAASINPVGTVHEDSRREPEVLGGQFPEPKVFRPLSQSGAWTDKERIGYSVTIEVWNLRTRELIHTANYRGTGDFQSVRPPTMAPTEASYLLYKESMTREFRQIAQNISRKAIADLLL